MTALDLAMWFGWSLMALIPSLVGLALLAALVFRVLIPAAKKYQAVNFLIFPWALLIWFYDVAFNALYGSLLFWQLPFLVDPLRDRRCLTLSDRLQMLVHTQGCGTWRYRLAVRFARCVNRIEPHHIYGVT